MGGSILEAENGNQFENQEEKISYALHVEMPKLIYTEKKGNSNKLKGDQSILVHNQSKKRVSEPKNVPNFKGKLPSVGSSVCIFKSIIQTKE